MLSPELKTNLVNKNHIDEQIPQYKKEKEKNQRIRNMEESNGKWKYSIQEGSRNNLPKKWRQTWKKYKWKDPVDITVRDMEGKTENKHKEVEIKQL